jgi:hypothetical protein
MLLGLPIEVEVCLGNPGVVVVEHWVDPSTQDGNTPYCVTRTGPSALEIRGEAEMGSKPALDTSSRLVMKTPPSVEDLSADSCASIVLPSVPKRMIINDCLLLTHEQDA